METDPEAPCEELASAELDGPRNKVFETRDPRVAPKPPGVAVKISRWSDADGQYWYCWLVTLDGVHLGQFEMTGISDAEDNPFATSEAAKADCREKVAMLVDAVLGLPLAPGKGADLHLNFVEE